MGKGGKRGSAVTKRTVKYLSVAPNEHALRAAIKGAPDSVVKSISDIALNAAKGDVKLGPADRRKFSHHRKQILTLAKKGVSLKRKRGILQQKGGFAWIPALVGSVLGILGGRMFDNKTKQQ
jgi:hypothetical protein